jgi:hypothetical protein
MTEIARVNASERTTERGRSITAYSAGRRRDALQGRDGDHVVDLVLEIAVECLGGSETRLRAVPEDSACQLAVIVTHPDRDAILVVAARGASVGWTLPSTTVARDPAVPDLIAAIDDLLGVRTVMLRRETLASVGHDQPTFVVAEIEPAVPSVLAGRWVEIDTLILDHVDVATRAAVDRWLVRRSEDAATPRAAWSRPGWFARASEWMLEALVASGRLPLAAPVQHYLWSLTCVLRARTTTGDAYLKATSPLFPQEVPVTALLPTRAPGLTPTIITTHPAEPWLLMADHGGRTLGDEPESSWAAGLETHAHIQRLWADDVASLRAAGAPSRSLVDLAAEVVTIGHDGATMAALGEARAVAYAAAMPRLTDACAQLESLGPGVSIVHGDFHPWNVATHDQGCVVFDWSDAAIGHPFMDLVPYVFRAGDIGLRRAMVDAYLARWSDVASPERLREAVRLALPLGCLYQVVSYRGIFAGLNPDYRADMHGADVDWLERSLSVLDQGIEADPR